MRALALRALRVFLVFALVFGTSLNLELALAYGSGMPDTTADELADHEDETLSAVVIYRSNADGTAWLPLDTDLPFTLEAGSGTVYFAAVPVWDGAYPQGYQEGKELKSVPSARFAEWEVAGVGAETAVEKPSNVLAATALQEGSTQVTCKAEGKQEAFSIQVPATTDPDNPDPDNPDPDNPDPDNPDPDTPVVPDNPQDHEPELVSVEILDAEGASMAAQPSLTFDADQVGATEQFYAQVVIKNLNAKDEGEGGDAAVGDGTEAGATVTYNSKTDGTLEEFTDGKLSLSWSSSNDEAATVTQDGLMTIEGEGTAEVACLATVLSTTEVMSYKVEVIVGTAQEPEENPQGESHPQDSLQILAMASKPGSTEGEGGSAGDGAGEGSGDGQGEGSGQEGEGGSEGGSQEGDSSDQGGSGDQNGDGDAGDEGAKQMIDKTYTLDDLRKLDASGGLTVSTETYAMRTGGKSVAVIGQGFPLMQLLQDAFKDSEVPLDEAPVESVDFIDYRGIPTTIDWATIQASAPMVAQKSRVIVPAASEGGDEGGDTAGGEGDGSGTASDGEGSGSAAATDPDATGDGDDEELLDNTRFRLLFNTGSDSIDSNALRYLKAIRLNMKVEDSNDFDAYVSYNPVPVGVEAVFVAVPVNTISGSWDCQWEQSNDKGETWQRIPDATGQSLTLLTTEERLGTYYRVVIENSAVVDGQQKTLTATSDPVEMKAGSGLVISYSPPRPGGLAVFRSSVFGYSGDVAKLQYIWEYSENGGITWEIIKGETKPTLELQTEGGDDPGSSGGSGDDSASSANLIYVRLRALTPEGSVMISNVQPLTVQVGGDEGGTPGESDDGRTDAPAGPQGGDTTKPTTTGSTKPSTQGSSSPTVIPLPGLPTDFEDLDDQLEASQNPNAALDPNGQATPSMPRELSLDDSVLEQLDELSQAQEQATATTPGARWTALKTLNPTGDDLQSILGDNPLAPYVMPLSLGLLVAGGLEKLIAFRRQLA